MSLELKTVAILAGAALAAASLPCVAAPAPALEWIRRFPRRRLPAWILTAIALLWSAWLLFVMPMERFDNLKPLLYVLTPLAFGLIIRYVDDLLAARALGGVLALAPAPMLDAARWHPSGWRFVVVILAYVMAVAGMALILSPYHFRKFMSRSAPSPEGCRLMGSAGIVLGAGLMMLGWLVY